VASTHTQPVPSTIFTGPAPGKYSFSNHPIALQVAVLEWPQIALALVAK
jgi:hypothetical protein